MKIWIILSFLKLKVPFSFSTVVQMRWWGRLFDLGDQFSGLHSEYCSEPYGLQVTQKILDRQNDLPEPSFHFHPASHTLLDIESVIRSNGFKDPKSMKDISGIFSKVFPTEKDGFYSVPDPLPVPSRLKPAPTGFDLPSAPALFQCEVFSPSTLSLY